jgi:hypothetical protein
VRSDVSEDRTAQGGDGRSTVDDGATRQQGWCGAAGGAGGAILEGK